MLGSCDSDGSFNLTLVMKEKRGEKDKLKKREKTRSNEANLKESISKKVMILMIHSNAIIFSFFSSP